MTDFDQQIAYYTYLFKKHGKKIGIGLFVLILALTSIRTVGPEEEGVVLNLGQYSRTVNPGLNFIAPFGIEKMYKIPVQRQLKHEFGFRTTGLGTRSEYSEGDFSIESSMLSGDLNMADVEWVVQYRIENSFQYLFRVKDPERSLPCVNPWETGQLMKYSLLGGRKWLPIWKYCFKNCAMSTKMAFV